MPKCNDTAISGMNELLHHFISVDFIYYILVNMTQCYIIQPSLPTCGAQICFQTS